MQQQRHTHEHTHPHKHEHTDWSVRRFVQGGSASAIACAPSGPMLLYCRLSMAAGVICEGVSVLRQTIVISVLFDSDD